MADASFHRRPPRTRWLELLAAMLVLAAVHPSASASALLEYDVKAAFLFNLAKYADWPPQAYANPNAPIVIGILGHDPFGSMIDRLVEGRVVNGRKVVIRRTKRASELRTAHIVFISESERDNAPQACAVLADTNVLCVGDTEQTANCAAVNFSVDAGKIVFTVNLAMAERARVKISSKLLHLAKAVKP